MVGNFHSIPFSDFTFLVHPKIFKDMPKGNGIAELLRTVQSSLFLFQYIPTIEIHTSWTVGPFLVAFRKIGPNPVLLIY